MKQSETKSYLRLLALVALVVATNCGGGSSTGTFVVSWDITINGVQVNACADAGVAAIETVATDQLDPNFTAYSDVFGNCDAFGGTTFPLPLSDYTVTWAALDSNDQRLNPFTEPAPFDVILSGNDQFLPLAEFDF